MNAGSGPNHIYEGNQFTLRLNKREPLLVSLALSRQLRRVGRTTLSSQQVTNTELLLLRSVSTSRRRGLLRSVEIVVNFSFPLQI